MPRSPRPLFRAGLAAMAMALLGALPVVTPRPPLASATEHVDRGSSRSPGYWLAGGDGSIYPFGSASDRGSLRGKPLSRPVVGMAPTQSGAGYWMVASDGGIFSFGDAAFYGSTGNLKLNQPIVGMAATPSGRGYWFVAADGGIFSFGDAAFYGSTGAMKLNKPIVGMAPTPTGNGYWFVASDGGIFSFGDAAFYGSTGAMKLNKPIVGMAPTPTGKGYWFVASDGGIFSFGDAAFYGSTGAMKLSKPIVGMAASPSGKGYWFVASDGGIFNFGDASFLGSAGGSPLPAGIVVMSAGMLPSTPTDPTTATTGPGSNTSSTVVTTPTGPPPTGEAFEIGLVGDTGYNDAQYPIFDRVVQQMNSFPLAFVVHDGDFKDPTRASCNDDLYARVRDSFNRSRAPFVYTPGDNEWMDCGKLVNNAMDPIDRLNELREMFFAQDQSLGVNPMPLTTQRQQGYPENVRWTKEGVVFATINAPGPSDDLDYAGPNPPEAGARRVANLAWLRQTFESAKATNAPAVMIIWQVDPWQPKFRRTWDYLIDDPAQDGAELKQLTQEFGRPVVLVHGDTHIPQIDKGGWRNQTTGAMTLAWDDLPNFTRVETYAGGQAATGASAPPPEPNKWVRVTVDPKSPQVFTFTTEQAP